MNTPAARQPNRLAQETSPYLQQHQFNPVDWYPWGPEALDRARDLGRPIFLSIGYSACHWCHVMEHESFEDPAIAQFMNDNFVNIKVDREERPDIDQIYMQAVMAISGSGGWPMSVFLTPSGQPFFGGTYWPPTTRFGRPGFRQVLEAIASAWQQKRTQVVEQAAELTGHIAQATRRTLPEVPLDAALFSDAVAALLHSADKVAGGFGRAPKFPHAIDLRVLLRGAAREHNPEALAVATLTLERMARGGIYDHLGGGFARYSTDGEWLVPHFEKMLYDNALLVPAYLEAYQITGRQDFAQVARETLDYVLREMARPEGGFASSQDADSEGVEGKFFVWTVEELQQLLGKTRQAEDFCYVYGVTAMGNWEHTNILHRRESPAAAAAALGRDSAELERELAETRCELFAARSKRVAPGRDDKILTSWNAWMITALCFGARVLGDERYLQAAVRATDFLLRTMRSDQGQLLHAYKDGRARFRAYLEDYAALLCALVDVHQETQEPLWLEWATSLAEEMINGFWDNEAGGFFFTATDHEPLITRNKDPHDNATPAGNSQAIWGLLRLGRLTGRADFEGRSIATLEALSGQLEQQPMASGQALIALDYLLGPSREIVFVGNNAADAAWQAGRIKLARRFAPNDLILRRPADVDDTTLPKVIRPLVEGKTVPPEGHGWYVCTAGTCQAPVTELP